MSLRTVPKHTNIEILKKSRHLDIHVPNRLIQLLHEVHLDKNNVMVSDGVSLWPLFYVKKPTAKLGFNNFYWAAVGLYYFWLSFILKNTDTVLAHFFNLSRRNFQGFESQKFNFLTEDKRETFLSTLYVIFSPSFLFLPNVVNGIHSPTITELADICCNIQFPVLTPHDRCDQPLWSFHWINEC